MVLLILFGTDIQSGFMPQTWFLPLLFILVLVHRLMITRRRTPWQAMSSRPSSHFLRESGLWSSKVWPVLGSSPATCATEFNPEGEGACRLWVF
jgi:hypothetical protein